MPTIERMPEWRAAIGWCVVAAMGWHFVVRPVASFALGVAGLPVPPAASSLELYDMLALVAPALGLGYVRAMEGGAVQRRRDTPGGDS